MHDIEKYVSGRAGEYHKQGYNCAESIFMTFREYLNPVPDADLVRFLTPFGGGLGRAGCVCGALSGGVMIIGAARGRIDTVTPRDESYRLSSRFHDLFRERFGATCCRVLLGKKSGEGKQRKSCNDIISETAEILVKYMIEEGVIESQ